MPVFVALLRAVNVGGTGKLAMRDLVALCGEAGFTSVKTYIASGNVVFTSSLTADAAKAALEARLAAHAGKPIGVHIRTAEELVAILATNPFPDRRPDRTVVLFLDSTPPSDTLDGIRGRTDEEIALGSREIFVHYGEGMARSKLKIPAAREGTGRNINTVRKLAEMAAGIGGS